MSLNIKMTYKDKTFCKSPNCTNECGRKLTPQQKIDLAMLEDAGYWSAIVSYAYFCGEQLSISTEELPPEFKDAYEKNKWDLYESDEQNPSNLESESV